MIHCFKESQAARAVILILAVLLAVLVSYRDRYLPIYIPVIAVVLILAIGYMSGTVLGNYIAERCNQKKLALLHVDLNPERFVREYSPVPGHLPEKSSGYAIASAYLADGYCAMGQWDTALQTLCDTFTDKDGRENLSLKCLYFHNRCNYELQKGAVAAASADLHKLQEAIVQARKTNPGLAQNMENKQHIFRCWLDYYEGRAVDTAYLKQQFDQSRFQILKLEIALLLMKTALRDGDEKEAESRKNYLKTYGGELYMAKL